MLADNEINKFFDAKGDIGRSMMTAYSKNNKTFGGSVPSNEEADGSADEIDREE